jgi:hypothetical protein
LHGVYDVSEFHSPRLYARENSSEAMGYRYLGKPIDIMIHGILRVPARDKLLGLHLQTK